MWSSLLEIWISDLTPSHPTSTLYLWSDHRIKDVRWSNSPLVLMCRMCGRKKNIKWAMILLPIGVLTFCYLKGWKITKIFYSGLWVLPTPTPHKYLYLWSDHCTKGMQWSNDPLVLTCRICGGKKNIKWTMILLPIDVLTFCYLKGLK